MEKRFVLFVVFSMLVLIGYQALDSRLNPRPEPAADAAADGAAAPAADEVAGEPPAVDSAEPAETAPQSDETAAATASDGEPTGEAAGDDRPDEATGAGGTAAARLPRQWTTLGSLDRTAAPKMLVWFTNQGASIECIAINDDRYLDLDDHHGYLGFLAWQETAEGPRVGAVGAGTAAARAINAQDSSQRGLQPGDCLVRANDQSIRTAADVEAWLAKTQPGDSVTLEIRRGDQTLNFQTELDVRPLEVIRPDPVVPNDTEPPHPLSYLLGLQRLGTKESAYNEEELPGLPSLREENWELHQSGEGDQAAVEFHFVLTAAELEPFGVPGPLRIIKRYQLGKLPAAEGTTDAPPAYHLDYQVSFRNESSAGQEIQLAFSQYGPAGLPLEGWWYTYKTHPTNFGGAGVRDIVAKSIGDKHKMFTNPKIVDRVADNPQNPATPMYAGEPYHLQYVGVDAQYFTSALLADPADSSERSDSNLFADVFCFPVAAKNSVKPSLTDVSFRLISPLRAVPAGGEYTQRFRIFAGPKQPDILAAYQMDECITYGWFPLIAKPLTWILHSFYTIFRNYGIAIILLTVMVRGCMYPLGRQQALNAQKMQELAPEMRRIADQYKNDIEKRTKAQQDLFKKHNYNPLAGCLPMFFQLPIFVGLYRALSVDIELRQAALIPGLRWCSNLAGPDQLWNWEGVLPAFLASHTGWLGPYLNILPLISVAFMMVHQKMFTPPPTDEQQEIQQKMMKFMMLFFALMFFRVPAGLCLYFITSSAWGLAERKLLPKPKLAVSGEGGSGGAGTSSSAPKSPAPGNGSDNGPSRTKAIADLWSKLQAKADARDGASSGQKREQRPRKKS